MHLRFGHHGLAPPCASPPDLFVDTSAILPGIQRVAAQNALGLGRSIPSGPKRFLAPLFEGSRPRGGPGEIRDAKAQGREKHPDARVS